MSKRETPQINASSMADIAFLLLIFFLVSTTMNVDIGIQKKLPDKREQFKIELREKNVLEISINSDNEILVENKQLVSLSSIKNMALDFIDNGGGLDAKGQACTWCQGKKNTSSSDHPAKAVIQIQSSRTTSYGHYIKVQNEVLAAYAALRNTLAQKHYNKSYDILLAELKKDKNNKELRLKIKELAEKYPILISEIDPSK